MSTITADTTQNLLNVLATHLPSAAEHPRYRVQINDAHIVIDVEKHSLSGKGYEQSAVQRAEALRLRLQKLAVPGVNLPDHALSREAFYSEDT